MGAYSRRLRLRVVVAGVPIGVVVVLASLVAVLFGSVAGARAAVCPNEGFRTGTGAALPDCRAYEMVSPPDKNGGEVDGGVSFVMYAPEQAARDGEAVTYGSSSAFSSVDPASAMATSQYLSRRTADGWVTREIVPAQQLPGGKLELAGGGVPGFSLFQGFTEDLDYGFLLAWNPQPDPAAPAGYFNPYLFESENGGYRALSTVKPPSWPAGGGVKLQMHEGFGATYAGMSEDGQRVFFEANDALAAKGIPHVPNLYEWSDGGLELVNVLPNGSVDPEANFAYVSHDGRRAFWSGGAAGENQLYMYEKTGSGTRTTEVSASQEPGVPSGSAPATFEAANGSGSRVYFTSGARLTSDSTAAGEGKEDLYQYNAETGVLTDVTVDRNAGEAASVLGVLGMGESEGVPYVYFAARGVLAQGAAAQAANIYVWRGDTGSTSFVAQLSTTYEGETNAYTNSTFYLALERRTSRVSADGQMLAFQSARPLTGYDNTPANGQQCPQPLREGSNGNWYEHTFEGRCMEVYEYDARTGKLACVSCNPAGLPPIADSLVPETPHLLENVIGWQSSTVQQRYLLDDGRLFFQSEDALLPAATNRRQNVYEYEPEGVGQCVASGQGACLYLISTGTGEGNSYFADASEDGRDVFFVTNQQLVPQDGDEAMDMYDAREGGGFSTPQLPPCAGEACKPAITPAPAIYGAPASATFQAVAGGSPAASVTTTKVAKKVKTTKRKPKKRKEPRGKRARRRAPGAPRRRVIRSATRREGRS